MVILIIRIQAPPSGLEELSRSCRLEMGKIRREAGCLDCRLSGDVENETILTLEETWENRARLDAHFRSDRFSALIGAMKRSGGKVRIHVRTMG